MPEEDKQEDEDAQELDGQVEYQIKRNLNECESWQRFFKMLVQESMLMKNLPEAAKIYLKNSCHYSIRWWVAITATVNITLTFCGFLPDLALSLVANGMALLLCLITAFNKSTHMLLAANYMTSLCLFRFLTIPYDYKDFERGPAEVTGINSVFLMITLNLSMGMMLMPEYSGAQTIIIFALLTAGFVYKVLGTDRMSEAGTILSLVIPVIAGYASFHSIYKVNLDLHIQVIIEW